MVDVSAKAVSRRSAHARAELTVPAELAGRLRDGDIATKKGPVFQTAIIAGTQGAKRTSDLIPFCHPLGLERCDLAIEFVAPDCVKIDCRVGVTHRTGVEMEALTGVTVAALTVYDMLKAVSHDIVIRDVRLMGKTGGKRDFHRESET